MDDMQRDPATTTTASATGTVQSVDASAGTVTIDHGPVDALRWPAMTMTFQAPDVELGAIEKGDQVSFEFTSTGMDGTITSITEQSRPQRASAAQSSSRHQGLRLPTGRGGPSSDARRVAT